MAAIDLSNIQGDILTDGFPKFHESFFFFKIEDAGGFCKQLKKLAEEVDDGMKVSAMWKRIKEHHDAHLPGILPVVGANIAFSMQGLKKMSEKLKQDLQLNKMEPQDDEGGLIRPGPFTVGMKGDSAKLGDPRSSTDSGPAWEAPYLKPEDIHGVIVVTGDSVKAVVDKLKNIQRLFNYPSGLAGAKPLISEVVTENGKTRPAELRGREHFGFEDGISQPAVNGVDNVGDRKPLPSYQGAVVTPEGRFLCGRPGDLPDVNAPPVAGFRGALIPRPSWMLDGSFMVFRKLEQDVSRWNEFLFEKAKALGIKPNLLGARLMGRWKSGCPVQLSPEVDDTALGKDEQRNNNFAFDAAGDNQNKRCPVGAHIRKTFPRNEVSVSRQHFELLEQSRIMRRGIPYGAELDADPDGKRGLLFVCYQSNLTLGYRFIQRAWANSSDFRFAGAGLDSIIGQSNDIKQVDMLGISPLDAKAPLKMDGINRFVISRGGEYFFMPSMTALRTTLSTVTAGV